MSRVTQLGRSEVGLWKDPKSQPRYKHKKQTVKRGDEPHSLLTSRLIKASVNVYSPYIVKILILCIHA